MQTLSVPVVVFVVAAMASFYCVLGYPLLLAVLARLRPRPVQSDSQIRTVSVLIAVYNGAGFIAEKLDSIFSSDYPAEALQVVVVSDGSTDETEAIVSGYISRGVRLISLPRGGKPAALNAGFDVCTGEILVLTDVRQRLEVDGLRQLVGCFGDPSVAVASGELIIEDSDAPEKRTVGLYWRYESWIRRNLSRYDSMLGATGPFYAIRRNLVQPVPAEALLDDMYLPMTAFLRGYRLVLNEQARAYDVAMDVRTEFRRKVRTLAGNYQLMWLLPQVLTLRNRMLFHYLSYKTLRLFLPFMALALLLAGLFISNPWGGALTSAQASVYAAAIVDPLLPRNSWIRKISNPCRVVGSFLLASVYALKIFFLPPQDIWKPTQADRRNP